MDLSKQIQGWSVSQYLFSGFAAVTLLSIFGAIITDEILVLGAPGLLLLVYLTIVDFKATFFLLFAMLAFSMELDFDSGLATYMPVEPMLVGLLLVFLVFWLSAPNAIPRRYFMHPISLLLLLHVGWIAATTITSSNWIVSLKFLLAKIWYIFPLYFLPLYALKSTKDIKRLVWFMLVPIIFTIFYVWVRHAGHGFSYDSVEIVLGPFYRNHVNYASFLVVFFPYGWYLTTFYKRRSLTWWVIVLGLVIILIAIQLAYTRAAYLALMVAGGAYVLIRFRLVKYVLIFGFSVILLGSYSLMKDNTYLDYAPNFERTVSHESFDNLLEATYKGTDISLAERCYRWIAAYYMFCEKPLLGFGPANFYNYYKSYTVNDFMTYVSDNPEQSGIHSYYFMTLVEQGIPGLLFFLALVFTSLLYGEHLYHQLPKGPRRTVLLMSLLSLVVIDWLQLINDLIETDKIGPFFFLALAVIVKAKDLKEPSDLPSETK